MLTACGDARSNDTAADVDGTEVSRADYEDLLQYLTANPGYSPASQADPRPAPSPATPGVRLLAVMVLDTAGTEFLADSGESITDADRQAVLDTIAGERPGTRLRQDVLDLLVDQQAGAAARGRILAPDVADLERRYDELAGRDGRDVRAPHRRRVGGRRRRTCSRTSPTAPTSPSWPGDVSIEPAAAETGGALEAGDGSACIPLRPGPAALDPLFVAGARTAVPGSPTGPVESSFGWHVIEARPWDEVEESVVALYDQAAGELGFAGYLATADIDVDPRYGRWDPLVQTIVAL